jgi:hypothetical protein
VKRWNKVELFAKSVEKIQIQEKRLPNGILIEPTPFLFAIKRLNCPIFAFSHVFLGNRTSLNCQPRFYACVFLQFFFFHAALGIQQVMMAAK